MRSSIVLRRIGARTQATSPITDQDRRRDREKSPTPGGRAHTADALFSSPSVTDPTALVNQPLAIGSDVAILTGVPEKKCFLSGIAQVTSPPHPNLGRLVLFFERQKIPNGKCADEKGLP